MIQYLDTSWLEPYNQQRNTNLERPGWASAPNLPDKLFEVAPQPQRPLVVAPPSTKASHRGGSRVVGIPDMEDLIGWHLRWFQRECILSDAQMLVMRAARRSGKDVSCTIKAVFEAMKRVGTVAILYPTESQAMESIVYGSTADGERTIEKIIPRALVQPYIRDGQLCYRYPSRNRPECILTNGSKIRWFSCQNQGKRLVGNNWILAVFAEAAHITNLHSIYYDQVAPILSKSKGRVVFQAAHHEDNDEFDRICQLAEAEKDVMMPDGRRKWHLITVTPRDYMTREQEWLLEMEYVHDRPALARHFYQKRGHPSINNSVIGQWLHTTEFKDNLLDKDLPVFCVWDIGGSCNTAIWIMQIKGDSSPPRFIKVIYGNRQTDPHQSTIYYLEKVRSYLTGYQNVLHITPHDSTALKNLDHTLSVFDILSMAGAKVFRAPRAKSKAEAIQTVIEYMRTNPIHFDFEAQEGVLSLCRVKWKIVNGVAADCPERSLDLDCFDAFLYCILLLVGKYQRTPQQLVTFFYPHYKWPHERVAQQCIPKAMEKFYKRRGSTYGY